MTQDQPSGSQENGILHIWTREKMPFSGEEVDTFSHVRWEIPVINNSGDLELFNDSVEKILRKTSNMIGRELQEWSILNITKFPT